MESRAAQLAHLLASAETGDVAVVAVVAEGEVW